METVFQLVRVRLPSSSSSSSLSSPTSPVASPWSLEVPESTRTLLEDITQPIVVISYLSQDREVRDALWTAFKDVYGWNAQPSTTTTTTSGGQEIATGFSMGVWGWISPPDTSQDDDEVAAATGGGDSKAVRRLHLLFGGDNNEDLADDDTAADERLANQDMEGVERVVWSLLSLCSTYLTVMSPGLEATRQDIERLVGLVQPLVGDRKGRNDAREKAVLEWRWVGQNIVDKDQDLDDGDENEGRAVLESVLDDYDDIEQTGDSWKVLDTVCKVFDGVNCKAPTPVGVEWSRRGSEVDAIRAEAATGTFRILCDYSVDDNKAEKRYQWIRKLWMSFDGCGSGVEECEVEYPKMFSDKRPIPLPWHTLAMVHLRAQSIACEEIEARFWGAGGGGLGLKREHHLSALDEHWQALLKNRLSGAKNGVSGGSNGSGGASLVEGSSSGLSKAAPHIKDYTEFLLAVDQVRRGYLESCIPSPEALSVLENLDEMQQSESILFLQTLAATAPAVNITATTTANTTTANAQQQQQPASAKSLRSKRYSITNHPTVALNGRELMIHPAAGDDSRISNTSGASISSTRRPSSSQAMEAPTELEQQIADILMSKRGRRNSQDDSALTSSRKSMGSNRSSSRGTKRSAMSLFQGMSNGAGVEQTAANGSIGTMQRKSEDKDKAVVQFGWTFYLRHANSLQYAWIWDWLSTHTGSSHQNVVACDNKIYTASKWMILPARDTVVARTRAGKQKEWKIAYGDRVWLVSYWYSTRNAIMELPEYLPRARGGACGHVLPYGETYVICRTCPADVLCMQCFRASDHADHSMYLQCSWGDSSCLIDEEDNRALCVRCFHSHNHYKHDVVVQLAEAGSSCSCEDGYSYRDDLICTYHSPGELEVEYRLRTIPTGHNSTVTESDDTLTTTAATVSEEHRCMHVFQQDEDVYHCQDCSTHDGVALCSRCFFASDCVTHQWRAGQFSSDIHGKRGGSTGLADDALASVVDGLGISQGAFGGSTGSMHPLVQQQQDEAEVEEDVVVRCGCGDPSLFKKAFDCNYHLPQEFRPVAQSHHCSYLFQRQEVMFRCRTCHVSKNNEDVWICGRCFVPAQHVGHETEEAVNHWNEGLYCRCGDPGIFQDQAVSEGLVAGTELRCWDDHNRQTVLCATKIKDGMFYYRCQVTMH
ncbi:hypothetical protein KI688_001769 [Linnemannia hyalina]|uniref:E3 ubiquitin-protein ligase n=1 Tax=Linnemannia hyalina TaxID=64524 RepID=A0A9P8BRQ5_9FUNG|nr:hypothetical protein KI688_001769 [Linnemannia hyalina]